jgi:hypothetical protein
MFETLARVMGPADTLEIRCEACGRRTELTRAEAVAMFGADAAPYDIRRRAKCGACGERSRIEARI